jgi:hypothetical protein
MSDDLTVLRLDVDADAVRALFESIPGLSPAELSETGPDEAGAETAAEPAPSRERTGPRVGETPPPGAGDQHDPAVASESSDGRSTLLVAAVAGAVLAAVAAVGALLYRRRSSNGGSLSAPDLDGVPDLNVGPFGDDEPDEEATETPRPPSTVDSAPLIGMAALAVGGVVVRTVRSGADADD